MVIYCIVKTNCSIFNNLLYFFRCPNFYNFYGASYLFEWARRQTSSPGFFSSERTNFIVINYPDYRDALTLWHSERPKLHKVLDILSAIGLRCKDTLPFFFCSILEIIMGHNSIKTVGGIMVLNLCTSSDDALYLYYVFFKHFQQLNVKDSNCLLYYM